VEKSVERTQRTVIRLLFGVLFILILLIGAIWGGHDVYVRWQEKRLVRRATLDIENGNERDASLAARSILQMKPSSASAARIMAELAERAGERAALDWRRKVVQSDPRSVDDALALVRCAVKFNDISTAERTLAAVDEGSRNNAPYHEASALVAQFKHQDEKAEAEWNEALRLKPDDKSLQLQLGVLRLRSSDPERRAAGEALLATVRSDPSQRSAATRALLNWAVMRRENPGKLMELARDLQAYPEATWSDRLIFLDLLHGMQDPQFSSYLTELEKKAADNPNWLATLLSWMSRSRLNILALDYVKTLPAELLQKWPVPIALADVLVQQSKWQELEAMTTKAHWSRFDFLRHAYLSRALREQGKAAEAEREWATAAKQSSDQSDLLTLLIQTASEWKWENESTDLLWSLSKHPEKQKEAFLALYRAYAKAADTQGLYRVLARLADFDATNLDVQNNRAQVSLLLDANPTEARRLAADVYNKSPKNPAYITTFAYSLLTQGNAKEAVRIMNSLSPEQLNEPTISAYYGICLAATGDEKARSYLDFGKQASLLPEEKALIDKAYANLNSRSRNR
jgi:thioredoxin-like negative regulator of GroEL